MHPAVLITGAARRIGAVLARRFAAAGWHVVVHHGDSHDEAAAVAAALPSAEVVACDLRDLGATAAMAEDLAARLPEWRAIVNCAAVFTPDPDDILDAAVFDEAMRVNAAAPVRLAQAFFAAARSSSPRTAIHFLDQKIANPNPDFLSYSLAKHALAGAVRLQAMQQKDPRDRVYGLAPGAMLPSHDQAGEEHEISGRMNLLERLTDPDELADAALFLSGGVIASGETLFVDSGQHLLAQPRDVLYLARGLT
jgi:NAD(P)-dependent dehydrogenase (short-subunit alcohol dehydrogenase family)